MTRCTGELLDMPPVILHRGTESTSYQLPMNWLTSFNGAAKEFIDCLVTGRQPDMDIHSSKRLLQAALAVYASAEAGREVDPSKIT